jgi:glutamate N-acetyltransferase / amino-acid N-acetyltransferase
MTAQPVSSHIYVPRGFRFSAAVAGIKKAGRLDVAMAEAVPGTTAAAVFTRNLVVAAPLLADKIHLKKTRGAMRAVIVNAGNANCATGDEGFERCKRVCEAVARHLTLLPREVFPSSTGVIGVQLPAQKIIDAIPHLVNSLDTSGDALSQFSRAIMTTDTRQKTASTQFRSGKTNVTVTGVAKGAGMIHPNMATMLAYIFTDAGLPARELQRALNRAVAGSFNAISVDGDTSTNDTVLLMASGAIADIRTGADKRRFQEALNTVCASLAEQIVRDGEGVRHIVRLHVEGARTETEARKIADVIATSALVKTAFAGADPNWGRVLAAIGRAGVALDPNRVDIYIGEARVCHGGMGDNFHEPTVHATMSEHAYDLRVNLGRGRTRTTPLPLDLTAQYVHINADYRS